MSGKKCTRMSCCKMHTLLRCGLGAVTYLTKKELFLYKS